MTVAGEQVWIYTTIRLVPEQAERGQMRMKLELEHSEVVKPARGKEFVRTSKVSHVKILKVNAAHKIHLETPGQWLDREIQQLFWLRPSRTWVELSVDEVVPE